MAYIIFFLKSFFLIRRQNRQEEPAAARFSNQGAHVRRRNSNKPETEPREYSKSARSVQATEAYFDISWFGL